MGGQKSVAIACVFTYHLPLRVLLLPEGGEFGYYRLSVILDFGILRFFSLSLLLFSFRLHA